MPVGDAINVDASRRRALSRDGCDGCQDHSTMSFHPMSEALPVSPLIAACRVESLWRHSAHTGEPRTSSAYYF
jgi:hypothetical protein